MRKKRMAEDEFQAVRQMARLSDERLDMAYKCLVDGKTLQEVAAEHGTTKQCVAYYINKVWDTKAKFDAAVQKTATAGKIKQSV